MDKGEVFEKLVHLARKNNLRVFFCPFDGYGGRIMGHRIGIQNSLGIEAINYNLAHEMAHYYLHFDKGDITQDNQCYEEQADRAAHMILDVLSE